MSYKPRLVRDNGTFKFVDSINEDLKSRKVVRLFQRYKSFFVDYNNLVLSPELNYVEIVELIEKINLKLDFDLELEVDSEVQAFIAQNRYAIEEQRIAGRTIKEFDTRWSDELSDFESILNQEIARPLMEQQVQASFFLAVMKRAANFSVPGSGKTAMMYGAYAYLSSDRIQEVDKILIISPLNAFEAWRTEYKEVFREKRILNFINLKNCPDASDIRTNWGIANVIVLNYESLFGWKLSVLNGLIDKKTMVVFDEVHRVKNPEGKRAKSALELGKQARYHYVLTGTPIPNSYKDIYNFLHLLYDNEYNSFFGWSINDLENPNSEEINEKLLPFFWRTNKADLKVPEADEDITLEIEPNSKQKEIAETIYEVESNVLSRYIRLLQASTNPALLTEKINLKDLGFLFEEIDYGVNEAIDSEEKNRAKQRLYLDLNVESIRTPKYEQGISLIKRLVSENKKVLVWGMFVGTMTKIYKELNDHGIKTHLIYGATPKEERVDLIDEFREGDVKVLISNPATLGESISLHQSVHDAVYFEYNFNLTFMLQSRDRIHRLGLAEKQYTRYYYLMTEGDAAHQGYIDRKVYDRLKEKEEIMMKAIEGEHLVPEVTDDYLDDVKRVLADC